MDDLAGLSRSHPRIALLLVLFLFSLMGLPLTAGFWGKVALFAGALGLPGGMPPNAADLEQRRFFILLAVIGAVNAAIGGWYYLRIAAVAYLRDTVRPIRKAPVWSALAAIGVCALITLWVGFRPLPLFETVNAAVRGTAEPANVTTTPTERTAAAE